MIGSHEILLIVLVLGSFILFRFFSRTAVPRSNQSRPDRMVRIRNATYLFRYVIGIALLMSVYRILAFLFSWPSLSPQRLVFDQDHIYASAKDMPGTVLAIWLVKMGLNLASGAALFALFGLYGRGVLFSARNVLYIRFQGYYLILSFVVDYFIQSTLHFMELSTTPVFMGLLIIFVAWIMDEGRKIQEEQALTV